MITFERPFIQGLLMEDDYFHIHFVAFHVKNDFALGYHIKTKKAFYYYTPTICNSDEVAFHFDTLSHCNDEYTEWAVGIMDSLHITIQPASKDGDFYDILIVQNDEEE